VSVECNLLISLLKLTKEGAALTELVKSDAKIPTATTLKLLGKLQTEGLVNLEQGSVEIDSASRLTLAVRAAALGADIEHISHLLCWQEFEEIAAHAFLNNGYAVKKNVRFKHGNRRWEIDVVGCRKPLVICVDCKHWQHTIASSALKKMVTEQLERTHTFADSLPNAKVNFECVKWDDAKFIPAVLSLLPSAYKFYYQVPIVPVLKLQDFINQLPAYIGEVKFFAKTFNRLSHDF
jgi:Holliday junction resolvase-like predicted endonuclease